MSLLWITASKWSEWEMPGTRCAICKQDLTRLDDFGHYAHEDSDLDEHHEAVLEHGEPDPSHVIDYRDPEDQRHIYLPPEE